MYEVGGFLNLTSILFAENDLEAENAPDDAQNPAAVNAANENHVTTKRNPIKKIKMTVIKIVRITNVFIYTNKRTKEI